MAEEKSSESTVRGALIINADDWGQDSETTKRILECSNAGAISSVSAMVFMEESERAAALAQEYKIDAGLHLNLTSPFSAAHASLQLREHQRKVAAYLRSNRFAEAVYHPGLASSFAYVTRAQLEEFGRLYGSSPNRIDGHHHKHLSVNVILGRLLPKGTVLRRSFSFDSREKSMSNRAYRAVLNHFVARRHRTADYFFSLPPLEPLSRLQRIFLLARAFAVEVETHPVNADEYKFLTQGGVFRLVEDTRVAREYPSLLEKAKGGNVQQGSTMSSGLSCLLSCTFALGSAFCESVSSILGCWC